MIERFENVLQILVLVICSVIAMYQAADRRSRIWISTFFFYCSWLLGDIYWLVFLVFFDRSPEISVVCDLSWFASYGFLYLLLRQTAPPDDNRRMRFLPWIGPVFAASMAVFFMLRGEIITNAIYAVWMGILLFFAIKGVKACFQDQRQGYLPVSVLLFCLIEYGLWISSCFWKTVTLSNPYYWFDFLLTICFLLFLPATKKAVEE